MTYIDNCHANDDCPCPAPVCHATCHSYQSYQSLFCKCFMGVYVSRDFQLYPVLVLSVEYKNRTFRQRTITYFDQLTDKICAADKAPLILIRLLCIMYFHIIYDNN